MTVPEVVHRLVDHFHSNRDFFKSPRFNEARLRVEFVDPLLREGLGWDVSNERGQPEAYRDVIYEDRVKVGGGTKAPDYGFYLGGERRFFLETKKPSVDIRDDIAPALQLRRYAWSAKLPLSILTDFEEFSVYDCRVQPDKDDAPAVARLEYLGYETYTDDAVWERIADTFSREAVLAGSLDKYAEKAKRRRGTETVDDAFLKRVEVWRSSLAQDLISRNDLNQRQLNYAVQMTIDRLIFLRMAEDRGSEDYGLLRDLAGPSDVYGRLTNAFRDADDRYNSGLFHFRDERGREEAPDGLTPELEIGDEVLREIVRSLYYPDSPYEFSVLPLDVLGQVYEQFLGKVIRIQSGGTTVVEEKPEVRKAGGVYYTPTYIVDYIVERTVGRLLEGKRPGPRGGVSRLKVVDPACGSGSFLIGAYTYLLDWHRDRYIEDGPEKWEKQLYEGSGGAWHLTIEEKKRILLNNIYGVDIDPQAVEVTKLSLLLKVLEGETQASLSRQLSLLQERALPDLDDNIKCGNSLIGPDFYDNQELALFGEEDFYRINVFGWREAFPHVFEGGENSGFDAVIGNPPYIRIQYLKEFAPVEVEHYKSAYHSAGRGNYDIYVTFVEKGLQLLGRDGRLGYILPHKFFNAKYGEPVREVISSGNHLSEVVHFGAEQVFKGASTYTCLMFLEKSSSREFHFAKAYDLPAWRTSGKAEEGDVPAKNATSEEWNFVVGRGVGLFERIKKMPAKLGDVASIFVGLQTSADKIFVLEEISDTEDGFVRVKEDESDEEWTLEREMLKPFLNDISLSSYGKPESKHWIIFPYEVIGDKANLLSETTISSRFPKVWEYLKRKRTTLENREGGKWKNANWYAFGRSQNLSQMDSPKLIVQVISLTGRYAYDAESLYFTGGGNGPYYGVRWLSPDDPHSIHYLQGILNSRFSDFYLHLISTPFRGGYWSYGKRFIEQIPIRKIDFSTVKDVEHHDRMVNMVERMMDLNKQLASARISREKTVIGQQIAASDRQIDRLVYELYGLTDEEIEIVEEATARTF